MLPVRNSQGLMDRLRTMTDVQNAVQRLMGPEDTLATFHDLADTKPATMRAFLQMTVAVLVNVNHIRTTEPELRRRAASGN